MGWERRGKGGKRLVYYRKKRVNGRVISVYVGRSEEHTSELQSLAYLVCRLLLEKQNAASQRRGVYPPPVPRHDPRPPPPRRDPRVPRPSLRPQPRHTDRLAPSAPRVHPLLVLQV